MRVLEPVPSSNKVVPAWKKTATVNPYKAGLVLGSFVGLWHLAWSLLVATGAAQWLLDWVFYLHFLNNPLHVGAFNLATAIALVVITQ